MTDLTISLGQIRGASPCSNGWTKLLRSLGCANGPYDPSRRVTLGDIATANGAADAWWCVQCLDWDNITVRRAVIAALLLSVKRAAVHTADARVHTCTATIDQWLAGDDTVDLMGARAAAWAASDAAWAASRAAWAATGAAAEAAAGAARAAAGAAEAADAAWAADAAEAASWAAEAAMTAAGAAAAEGEAQCRDLINTFGRTTS